ncbi:hypothetical protein ACFYPN_17495 [Streptomyces sp. NPDC005576]|uniref:hypothetical protein n=1 Tax=Streptomyces sp. NPDC005576 TaxID=3364726 RepID=UPI0036B52B01
MAHRFAFEIPSHLLMWQRVREYAVPPSMIETATARRAVGDWAGACAAARVDVDLDLRAVRERHGTEFLTHLRADLRRLAPDLLRWHMPRTAPDGRLRAGLTLSLARYGRPGASTPLHLVARTPPAWADAGQRISLALWEESENSATGHGSPHPIVPPHPHPHPHPHPDRRFRLDLHRHLWDAGRSGDLAWRCGAAGPSSSVVPPHGSSVSTRLDAPYPHEGTLGSNSTWEVARWAAEAQLLLRAENRPHGAFTVRLGTRNHAVFELVAPDDSHVPTFRPLREKPARQEVAALPVLPEAAARALPDLELLRAGLIEVDRLHPLVTAALAAYGPVTTTGSASLSGCTAPSGSGARGQGLASSPGDPHRVECRGEVHRIALRGGRLVAIDHDPAQLRREELLVALGGPALPCLRAIDEVHRAPDALPAVRERLGHGDVVGALAVVEGLLGPGAVLRDGPLRDELESAAARRVDHGLFRAGLVATHPGAGGAAGGQAEDPRHPEAGHRPRPDRRTPFAISVKRRSRTRPRTGLFPGVR